nr:uncharacterized protein LOC112730265 [Arachis hypogaea]
MGKNTRYFHNLASVRGRSNRIDALVISGRSVRNQGRIKSAIRDFYKNLYHQEASPLVGIQDGLVNKIQEGEATDLKRMPSTDEIKEAVWDCESSKAPSCDGYNMNFIKKCWGKIGPEFTTAVMDFFQSAELPRDSNVTWVTLAPKFVEAREIKDLWPISMVGCVYKVISKVLVRRMRRIQVEVCEYCTSENGLWAKMVRMDQGMCVHGVYVAFHKWLPSKSFKMEWGLRQEDSLSPFLFVLVVEVLHRMVEEAVRHGRISPLLVGKENIELSHLQFMDDTILFCPSEE